MMPADLYRFGPGWESLAASVIRMAVYDIHRARGTGMIYGGKLAKGSLTLKDCQWVLKQPLGHGLKTGEDLRELLEFFKPGGLCQELCSLLNLPFAKIANKAINGPIHGQVV